MPNYIRYIYFRSAFLPWSYKCDEHTRCIKDNIVEDESEDLMSLGECKLTCEEHSVMWPKPREAKLEKKVTAFNTNDVEFTNEGDFQVREGIMQL
jgi:hypothetical protein